ncbi:ATP-dependent helicase [Actinotalea subterranea]|uniref:ATP-dependent helicase n=1 Tax=Actinotalea subterranea TaxID=2607497 RepID=UPI0011EC121F|nr:ATP-dependent DNA helicase [Actinotalea subterranea]
MSVATAVAGRAGRDGERDVLGAVDIARLLDLPDPTPEQVAIIESPLEPLLVVAGAGSGKTETMAARVVYLIANGMVEPDRVLGLTFTRKAAGELSERVRRRLRALRAARERRGAGGALTLVVPTVSTYNSYAAGLVGDHALRLGLEPSARLLGEAGRWQLAHEIVERWSDDLGVDLAPSTVTAAVLDLAGALAEHLVEPAALRAEAERLLDATTDLPPGDRLRAKDRDLVRDVRTSLQLRARLVDLVEAFTARKRQDDLIDFADQVALAARLAREVPDVGAAERARFGVVLLDEYQDTSVAQLELLRHLFGGASGDGVGHPVTAVGDPHQSIYGWRGASAGGLERFPAQFPARTAEGTVRPAAQLALSTSWRNDQAVLRAANRAAEPLRRLALAGASPVDLPVLRARPGAGQGSVAAAYLETIEDEARAVAEFIRARRTDDGGPPVTAAVLCRKRSQFPVLQAALIEAGLPVEVVGLGGLLSTPEVVDLVATLEAAHDPSRGDSLMRLLTGPRARLGLADLHALGDWAAQLGSPDAARRDRSAARDVVDEHSIVDALDALPPPGWVSSRGRSLSEVGRARLEELAGVLRTVRSHAFLPVVDLVAEAERVLGLDIEVAVRPGVGPAAARANLDAFRSVAASFSDGLDGGTLGAFLAWLVAAQREERGLEAPVAEMDPTAVQLLTVHAAKGLEWDVVAVPGLVERTFPMAPRTSGWIKDHGSLPTALRGDRDSLPDVDVVTAPDGTELARRLEAYRAEHAEHQQGEERRLAYVALTRARRDLLVSGSWWRDGSRPTAPSPFLTELLEDDAGEPVAHVEAWAPDPSAPDESGALRTPVRPAPPATDAPVWPGEHAYPAQRHERIERAADAVRDAARRLVHGACPDTASPDTASSQDTVSSQDAGPVQTPATRGRAARDLAEVAELLLEERRRGSLERSSVALPAHLSASALVRLAADPDAFALQLRRPVPLAPSTSARRGTAFHAWVERYFGSAALVDVDALPGADDATADDGEDLAELRERFLASEWAGRTPLAVEVDIETPVGGVVVRSRIDAVFPEPDGGVVVVDWKTGRPPTDPASIRSREIQLAVYRLAWSRWKGQPLDQVRAAFFYVSTGTTVTPTTLVGEDQLEALLTSDATRQAGQP